jgi:HEAT repeat protein
MAQSRQEVPVQAAKSDAVATPQSFVISRVQQTQVIKWIKQNQSSTTGVLSIAVALYLGVLALRPTWLLWLPSELQIPKTPIKLPPSLLLWLKYRPRVLDAWVNERIQQAQETFKERPTVRERKIHIPIPIRLNPNEAAIASLSAKDLQVAFAKQSIRLLILGEGGVGKTSLACQIAKWAMAKEKTERLCKHRMLPVLIEEELEAAEGKAPLLEAIARQIKNLRDDEKPISEELLKQLLEKRRILVIVDHFSEMSEATRKAIRLRNSSSPANALVITSRIEEILGKEVTHTTLKPLRVSSDGLGEFMHEYLRQQGKRHLFDVHEYCNALLRLSQIVTDQRDVTVLFAKLYADQMIAIAEGSITESLPDNVPDLMLGYINELNRNVIESKLEDVVVQRDAKVVAWECLKQSFKPEPAEREQIINSLALLEGEGEAATENAKKRLKYLEDRLALIRTVPPKTKIRFALDPLAEYLAALHLVQLYREDEQRWQAFLDETRNKSGNLEEVKGFLLALRDCCIARITELPSFLDEELDKLTGLDVSTLEQEQLRRQIQLLISDLSVIEDKDRVIYATHRIERIAEEIKSKYPNLVKLLIKSISNLIKLLKLEDEQVCLSAKSALIKMGSVAVPAIAELLKDQRIRVRQYSVEALRQIGSESSTAVSSLITILQDQDNSIRWNSAITLSKIGPAAQEAVPGLVKALKDQEAGVRAYAAFALGKIGPEAGKAIPDLLDTLHDENGNVLIAVSEALEAIGFDLSTIQGEVQLDDIKGTLREVILVWREKQYEAKQARKNSKGGHLEWLPCLSPLTPPQIDCHGTAADTPDWL